MPLKKFEWKDHPYEDLDRPVTQEQANEIIDVVNALEKRLEDFENKKKKWILF